MSYQNKPLPTAKYTGDDLIPLTIEREILAKRSEIENMDVLQKGSELALIHEAVSQIKIALGKNAPSFDISCSGCIISWKKLLKNWFQKHDQKAWSSADLKARTLTSNAKTLKPISQLNAEKEPTYGELVKQFGMIATDQEKKNINGGNPPKKAQLNEFFKTRKASK